MQSSRAIVHGLIFPAIWLAFLDIHMLLYQTFSGCSCSFCAGLLCVTVTLDVSSPPPPPPPSICNFPMLEYFHYLPLYMNIHVNDMKLNIKYLEIYLTPF